MDAVQRPERRGWLRPAWAVTLGVALVAALVSSAMAGPPGRFRVGADLASVVGLPAWTAAVVLLGVLAVVRPPKALRPSDAYVGLVCTIMLGIVTAGTLVWRAVAGGADARGFDDEQVLLALAGLAVQLALLVVVALRCELVHRPERQRLAARRRARPVRRSHLVGRRRP